MTHTLRPYQQTAIDALYDYWSANKGRYPLIVAPTGSGKSLIIAEFIRRTCTHYPDVRVVVVVDSRELVRQNEIEMRQQWPGCNTGIFSAGLNRKDTGSQIIFAGIQSVYRHADKLGKIDIILIDEAHMIPRKNQTRYIAFLKKMCEINPDVAMIGLTATPYRLDSGVLHEGDDAIFDGIAYDIPVLELVNGGYLCPVVSTAGEDHINLSGVRTTAGDYNLRDLERAANVDRLNDTVVDEIVLRGASRKAWLVFATGIDHAKELVGRFLDRGIPCELVAGETPKEERDAIVKRFVSGHLRCMVNVAVFTKGFNAPICDLIALVFSTKSTGKYVQVVGRGMRTYPGKQNCMLLDYGQNVIRHGPVDMVDPTQSQNADGKGKAPVKTCPECHVYSPISARCCSECGYQYPEPEPLKNISNTAFGGSVLSDQAVWVDVTDVSYARHCKPGKPDSIKATYRTLSHMSYHKWIALDHGGYATSVARKFVSRHGGTSTTVEHALAECMYWNKPTKILVKPQRDNPKFYEVLNYEFGDDTHVTLPKAQCTG